jgi:hypothetical protein
MVDITLHGKLEIENHEPPLKPGMNFGRVRSSSGGKITKGKMQKDQLCFHSFPVVD